MINKLFVLIIALSMVGCATHSEKKPATADEKYISASLEKTLEELAKKAVEAKRITMTHQAAMARLTLKDESQVKMYDVPKNMDIPYPLLRAYYGDAIQPLQQIADLTNYKFQIQGAAPETEVLWVKLHNQTTRNAFEIIQDISNQIDKRGFDIHIWQHPDNGKEGLILVSYRG